METSIAKLQQKNKELLEANSKYLDRLALRVEQNKALRDLIESQKATITALQLIGRKNKTLERLETFFTGTMSLSHG